MAARGSEGRFRAKRSRNQDDNDWEDRNGNDFDDEEDDVESCRISITGRSGKKPSRKLPRGKARSSVSSFGSSFQLMPWKDLSTSRKKKGAGIREKLEKLAKQSQNAYKEVYRRAKVLRSSPFEGILLKATWPENKPVPSELMTEIIKFSIPAFKYSQSVRDGRGPPVISCLHVNGAVVGAVSPLWYVFCVLPMLTLVLSLSRLYGFNSLVYIRRMPLRIPITSLSTSCGRR